MLIVLHRPWDSISQLREVLSRSTPLRVVIAGEDERFHAGVAYIGEPSQHLTLAGSTFGEVVHDPGRQFRNRTVDLLFQSVAKHSRRRVVGVVLAGSLDDGARGLAAINKGGGLSMVVTPGAQPQDGMPENAISYDGPIDFIGEPAAIAEAIRIAMRKSLD